MVVNPGLQGSITSLKSVFQSITPESCPSIYNFHLHTVYSDGQMRPEALVQQAVSYGLKGLAITDHHTVAGYQAARRWLDRWSLQSAGEHLEPYLWSGVEITAQLLGTEVHILGYGFDLEHSAIKPYLYGQSPVGEASKAVQVIQALQEAGGLAVLAHPARYKLGPADLIPAAVRLGIDGVEAYYCYGNIDPWQSSPDQTQRILELSQAYGLLTSCGTDSHGLSILKRI
ncbi:PHP domain-containing protein [Altericista sp. CCNU0014]|uniref:PHP domain-containing protein n=1 Tax=Altericista sp. CCNU0014 TaxID=3082949 RepID=UPI00384DA74C